MSLGLDVAWLGRRDYDETTLLQEELAEKRRRGEADDLLLVLEHPPTYTCGRRTLPGDLPQTREWYCEHGFKVSDTPRGGQVTYHGPGQLVVYPIIDLKGVGDQPEGSGRVDVAGFVSLLENAMIETTNSILGTSSIGTRTAGSGEKRHDRASLAGTVEGFTGVWVSQAGPIPADATAASMAGEVATGQIAKIGSIGLKISRGISSHGISLNVSCDLSPFESITACGIDDGQVTSILEIAGESPSVQEVGKLVASALAAAMNRTVNAIPAESLGIESAKVATA